jgi:hypothetical protein
MIAKSPHPVRRVTPAEALISVTILVVLLVIAFVVFYERFRVDTGRTPTPLPTVRIGEPNASGSPLSGRHLRP